MSRTARQRARHGRPLRIHRTLPPHAARRPTASRPCTPARCSTPTRTHPSAGASTNTPVSLTSAPARTHSDVPSQPSRNTVLAPATTTLRCSAPLAHHGAGEALASFPARSRRTERGRRRACAEQTTPPHRPRGVRKAARTRNGACNVVHSTATRCCPPGVRRLPQCPRALGPARTPCVTYPNKHPGLAQAERCSRPENARIGGGGQAPRRGARKGCSVRCAPPTLRGAVRCKIGASRTGDCCGARRASSADRTRRSRSQRQGRA
ncbi:hypothetical protein HYPSUDRAFT_71130 [Hypholoma sublateritium FD-334 SS-4]|uniref:Uncharacterized protein n=1 Tax=Hypholoma sublateritium (strain FD-334 SS-4) TaxID=945553 RepID=A0A0D2M0M6_HYPSF|nr:hypothetical protein HYPSUDRAFT_71130 [Hypholoma sublateritium FD-334 SS-4]